MKLIILIKKTTNVPIGTKIYWENLREFIEFLAKHEYDNLLKEYKIREKWGQILTELLEEQEQLLN